GRATPVVSERLEVADELVALLDGGATNEAGVVDLVRRLLAPMAVEDLFRPERGEDLVAALALAQRRIEDLTHQLARAEAQASGKLVPLDQARAQAEREAPTSSGASRR